MREPTSTSGMSPACDEKAPPSIQTFVGLSAAMARPRGRLRGAYHSSWRSRQSWTNRASHLAVPGPTRRPITSAKYFPAGSSMNGVRKARESGGHPSREEVRGEDPLVEAASRLPVQAQGLGQEAHRHGMDRPGPERLAHDHRPAVDRRSSEDDRAFGKHVGVELLLAKGGARARPGDDRADREPAERQILPENLD